LYKKFYATYTLQCKQAKEQYERGCVIAVSLFIAATLLGLTAVGLEAKKLLMSSYPSSIESLSGVKNN
jgi:hypothetical protein